MKAYVVAVESVHDEQTFAEYRKQVAGTLTPFKGRLLRGAVIGPS
jgi:uncharacterized protein (DUF1330 family)